MNMVFIADKFHLTLEQLDEVMSVEEYYSWLAYYDLQNDSEVYAMKHKGKKRPLGWYCSEHN